MVHAPGLVQGCKNVTLDDLKMTLSSMLWNTKLGQDLQQHFLLFAYVVADMAEVSE